MKKKKKGNNVRLQTKHTWIDYIGLYIFIWIIYIIFVLIKSELTLNTLRYLVYISFGIYIIQQLILKNFILYDQKLIIYYPASLILRKHIVFLNKVQNIKFLSNNSAYDPSRIIIQFKDGRKRTFYFVGNKEYQQIIDELKKIGINVYVKSHLWK